MLLRLSEQHCGYAGLFCALQLADIAIEQRFK